MSAIVQHRKAGGRIVVGVRANQYAYGIKHKSFDLLGEVSEISSIEKGRFLVEAGDDVLDECGTSSMHKAVGSSCLNESLRRGVGLKAVRYPFTSAWGTVRWCTACCYKPPSLDLHFKELGEDGSAAFKVPEG